MTNNGGPAFSQIGGQGLTIRDYFAGKALVGLLAKGGFTYTYIEIVISSYRIADAMIAERENAHE